MSTKVRPRPSLASRFVKAEAAKTILDPDAAPISHKAADAKSDERVQVLVRMAPSERKALRRIALEQDTTVQAIVEEAIRDVIRRHLG